jgi:hypothetical protein
MISEEQDRILGVELSKGSSGSIKSETDLITFLKKWSWGIESPMFVNGKFNIKKAEKGYKRPAYLKIELEIKWEQSSKLFRKDYGWAEKKR